MSLYRILKEKNIQLPLVNPFLDLDDFTWFLMEKLNEYSDEIKNSELHHDFSDKGIAISTVFKSRIPDFINSIGLTLDSYSQDPNKAHESFAKNLTENLIVKYLINMPKEIRLISPGYNFFRVRELKSRTVFNRKDLFHVPFEFRNRVSNCRYSKSEEPALYLSNSLEFAFRETKIYNDFAAVRLENIDEIKIINVDFSYFLSSNIEKIIMEENLRLQFLGTILPLITSCSIVRDESRDNYEYIIPQLLMRYVIENEGFDGIRYFSTRIDPNNEKEHSNNYNLVLPTKSSKTKGYDENLSKLFKMTEVIKVKKSNIAKAQSKLESMPAFEIDF